MNNILQLDETIFSCPVCGSEDFCNVFKPDVCKCEKCGTHFRNPRPQENVIIKLYDKGETFHLWQKKLKIRSHLWKKRSDLIKQYKSKGSILDIGTGDGFFIQFVKDQFEVDATEISKAGVSYASSRGHLVHHGTIFDKEFDDKSYDVITMWHVLEHLPDPGKILRKVRNLLKNDGVLFIAVPNEFLRLNSPLAAIRLLSAFPEHRFDKEIHLIHFTPRSFSETLDKIFGFHVIELLADDVHVYHRLLYFPWFYINSIAAKLFHFHLDKAMVFVCKKIC